METADLEHLAGRVLDHTDPLTLIGLRRIATHLAAHATGLPLDSAAMLSMIALESWFVLGSWCITQGVDLATLSPASVLQAAWTWRRSCCKNDTEADTLRFTIFGA